MMQKLQEEYPSRRDELLSLLGVDLAWRMHQVFTSYNVTITSLKLG